MSQRTWDGGDLELRDAEWDLEPLLDGVDRVDGPDRVEGLLGAAAARAAGFAETYRGRIADLDGVELRAAVAELGAVKEIAERASTYASLSWSQQTDDPSRGALMQLAQEQVASIEAELLFFELEWIALPDARADALLRETRDEPLAVAHFLSRLRARRPHMLSLAEERILGEVGVTSREAWKRHYGELQAAVRVVLDGEPVSVDSAIARLQDPDRSRRRETGAALKVALEASMPAKAFVFNTLLYEKSVDDRLRSYPHWIARRNQENEASDASVRALTEAVRGAAGTVQRWYRLKAKLLGVKRLADHDRFAPLQRTETRVSYGDARELVIDTYADFAPEAGRIVRRFFEERWIDAPPRPGKTGGAFCHDGAPSVHPYVLLNFEGTRSDILHMAHELGHGLHAALAGSRGIFALEPTVTVAETASVFGETLVFERMLAAAHERDRLNLLGLRIEGTIQTLFEAIAIHRFEDRAHTHRRERGELSVDELTDAWTESQAEIYGASFELSLTPAMWAYYPHFVIEPGYVYAYAFGQLLALSAFARFREVGPGFVPKLLSMLAAGSSRSPHELAAMIGIDLTDPDFWNDGLAIVDQLVQSAETLAARPASA